MSQSAGKTRYDTPLIALHWLMALMIFGLYAIGLSVDLFDKPLRPPIVNAHAAIGFALLTLVVPRAIWRMTHAKPAYPPGVGPMIRTAAAAGHGLLYLLMILVPVIGLRTFFLRSPALDFGLFRIPSPFELSRDLAHQAGEFHELFAHVLIALAAGHVLAALYHQFVLRDNLLARMKA
jgi:cytochrome b561